MAKPNPPEPKFSFDQLKKFWEKGLDKKFLVELEWGPKIFEAKRLEFTKWLRFAGEGKVQDDNYANFLEHIFHSEKSEVVLTENDYCSGLDYFEQKNLIMW